MRILGGFFYVWGYIIRAYNKPPISIAEQIELLKGRGLLFKNESYAQDVLSNINYYRLSGYCLPFEISRHLFKENTYFEHIVLLHEFDRQLRNLIDQVLELIEIKVRTIVVHRLTNSYGEFSHEEKSIYYNFFDFDDWLSKVHKETTRSTEVFIQHYKKEYITFPKIPFWVATEIMSFGSLSKMISRLKRTDHIQIAKVFKLHHSVFLSWLHTFVYIRNACAHHSKLWNRDLSIKLRIPNQLGWDGFDVKKIGSVIKAIYYMLDFF